MRLSRLQESVCWLPRLRLRRAVGGEVQMLRLFGGACCVRRTEPRRCATRSGLGRRSRNGTNRIFVEGCDVYAKPACSSRHPEGFRETTRGAREDVGDTTRHQGIGGGHGGLREMVADHRFVGAEGCNPSGGGSRPTFQRTSGEGGGFHADGGEATGEGVRCIEGDGAVDFNANSNGGELCRQVRRGPRQGQQGLRGVAGSGVDSRAVE